MLGTYLFLMAFAGATGQHPARDHRSEFERQVVEAGYIVVGTLVSNETRSIEGLDNTIISTVVIHQVLLGRLDEESINVVVWAPISHYDVDCCRIGCKYIFLLNESEGYFYTTRFGRGVHAIDNSSQFFDPV